MECIEFIQKNIFEFLGTIIAVTSIWVNNMNIRIIILIALNVIAASSMFGCGGSASAPPVDLPAPITGRVDVSSPDEDGNVTVTGTEGAVEGGVTVMAVNETVSGQAAIRLLDALIRPVYAQGAFPAICSTLGHACTVANADGSFTILLAADEDDSIVVGAINATTGDFTDNQTRINVPRFGSAPANVSPCDGKGLSGTPMDIAISPSDGTAFVLNQGSESALNHITYTSSAGVAKKVGIGGCYAHSLAVLQDAATGHIVLAATSKDDKKLWTAIYEDGEISGKTIFKLDDEPMHVTFVGSAENVVAALKTADSVILGQISLVDGTIGSEMAPIDSAGNVLAGLSISTAIDTIQTQAGATLGLLVTQSADLSTSYATFFAADTMQHLVTWTGSGDNLAAPANGNAVVRIAKLFSVVVQNQTLLGVAFVDDTNNVFYRRKIDSGNSNVFAIDILNLQVPLSTELLTSSSTVAIGDIVDLAISRSARVNNQQVLPPTAIVTTSTGAIVAAQTIVGGGGGGQSATLASNGSFGAIDINDSLQSIQVLNLDTGDPYSIGALLTWGVVAGVQ